MRAIPKGMLGKCLFVVSDCSVELTTLIDVAEVYVVESFYFHFFYTGLWRNALAPVPSLKSIDILDGFGYYNLCSNLLVQ
jgi:hypothetical protein